MKYVFKPLAKSVSIPLDLTEAVSATDAATHQKMFGLNMTTLIISNEKKNDIMKIVKSLEAFGLLIKGVSEQWKIKEEKNEFMSMFLGTLGTSLLGTNRWSHNQSWWRND